VIDFAEIQKRPSGSASPSEEALYLKRVNVASRLSSRLRQIRLAWFGNGPPDHETSSNWLSAGDEIIVIPTQKEQAFVEPLAV